MNNSTQNHSRLAAPLCTVDGLVEARKTATNRNRVEEHQTFLNAMSRRVSSVNLVVTDGRKGRFGLTVTSMCSVSAEPPMVMIGINRKSPVCDAITGNRQFVINVLSVLQKSLADSFSGGGPKEHLYDFSQANWDTGISNLPVLREGSAAFECTLESYQDVGCHRLFLGRVINATQGSAPTLCYSERRYMSTRQIA